MSSKTYHGKKGNNKIINQSLGLILSSSTVTSIKSIPYRNCTASQINFKMNLGKTKIKIKNNKHIEIGNRIIENVEICVYFG